MSEDHSVRLQPRDFQVRVLINKTVSFHILTVSCKREAECKSRGIGHCENRENYVCVNCTNPMHCKEDQACSGEYTCSKCQWKYQRCRYCENEPNKMCHQGYCKNSQQCVQCLKDIHCKNKHCYMDMNKCVVCYLDEHCAYEKACKNYVCTSGK